ncbi:MAG TPA: glycosyltransferase family 4 protein [Fibrobacteria bacterium]|nr:glycosyltransferase family 4 protein [Fibrobacteria bacterium]
MDILLVTQDFPPERGGIQTYVLELARGFMARGHAVRVLCPGSASDANPLPGLKDLVRLSVPGSFLFLPLLTYLPGYLRRNPGVTHVLYAQWQAAAAGTFRAGRRKSGKAPKSFCLVHGRELLTSVFGPLAPALMRRTFRRLDAAFPNSNEVLRLTHEKTSARCPLHLVHPGVDPGLFRPTDAGFLRARYGLGDAPVIVSITRMVARKNLRRLIEALPGVRAAVPGAVLVLGGTGPEREALMRSAADLDLSESVRFPGRIPDGEMAAHYSLGDVFALPSLSSDKDVEGFGIVYLEAGACEVPAVGGRAGGVPDAVADGETGLLVDPENTQEIQAALIDLLRDRAKARAMGRRARERIEKSLTWTAAADRVLGLMG